MRAQLDETVNRLMKTIRCILCLGRLNGKEVTLLQHFMI